MSSSPAAACTGPPLFFTLLDVLFGPLIGACGPSDEAGEHMPGMQGGGDASRTAVSSVAGDTAGLR